MRKPGRRSGQVVVEMLLILPVFLSMVFLIMETGYIAFRLIVLNHATYEVARIGGMTWSNSSLGNNARARAKMKQVLLKADVSCAPSATLTDPQAGQDNADLVCTGVEDVRLIFPMSKFILGNARDEDGLPARRLTATVRMPIERPLRK